ncbi:MAG TPA: tripartite tricarboxylate transporter substrate binding protein [Roseomonas sp.]
MIVPYAPGGGTDVVARLVAERAGATLGQPILVESRSGAGGAIGMAAAAGAPPDGYTLVFTSTSALVVLPLTNRRLTYQQQLAPLSQVCDVPLVFVLRQGVDAQSVADFVDLARRSPGKFTFASTGIGGLPHLMCEALKINAGIDLLHVPYRGDSAIHPAMLAREVDVAFLATTAAIPLIENGGARALAIAGSERLPMLRDVPTFAEAGYPDLSAGSSYGALAPAGTPRPVVDRLAGAIASAVRSPMVQERLRSMTMLPVGGGAEAYADVIRRETRFWGEVISKAGLTNLE